MGASLSKIIVTSMIPLGLVEAGPAAYAACQAAAAASCSAAHVLFAPCYAAAQSACATTLAVPEPWCTIL